MEYFWAALVSGIVLLVIWSIIANKVKHRRIRKATERIFPKIEDHIQADRRYNIFLSHGKTMQNVKFVGISPAHDQDNPNLPFPLCQWLIVEKPNGKRAYLKPESVRYYEDTDEESTNRQAHRSK
jgi:hypothetical protein